MALFQHLDASPPALSPPQSLALCLPLDHLDAHPILVQSSMPVPKPCGVLCVMAAAVASAVTYDPVARAIRVHIPGSSEEDVFFLHPATVRRNDRSAQSIDEWTGEQRLQYSDVKDDIEPEGIRPLGNYAVAITWPDGFTQVCPCPALTSPALACSVL